MSSARLVRASSILQWFSQACL